MSAATFTTNTSFDITSNRLLSVRTGNVAKSGVSSGDVTDGLQVWFQGFGEIARQSERHSVSGFDLASYGIAAGPDSEKLIDDAVVGAAFGYAATTVDSDGANNAETDIKSYQIILYCDYDLDNQTYLNVMGAYAYHDNEGTRIPSAGLVAKSDYAAHRYVARVDVGRDYPVVQFVLTPNNMAQSDGFDPAQSTVGFGTGIRYQMDDKGKISVQYDFEY